MKTVLLGKNLADIAPLLERCGMTPCPPGETPDVVVAYGGDGALLGAHRAYPDIPKLPLRDAATAPTCPLHQAEDILRKFAAGELNLSRLPELRAETSSDSLSGINDLVIHSLDFASALRCRVFIDGHLYAAEVVGDGVCFSGVHGSTGYYRSITRTSFCAGVGLAFSNPTEFIGNPVLPADSSVTVEILRGPGILIADNDPRKIRVEVGEHVTMRQSTRFAEVWGIETFMCPECRRLRRSLRSFSGK